MLDWIHRTLNPEIFQGRLDRHRYFEGWYYKVVDRHQRHRLALIPGISLDRAGGTSHAFVQAIDGNTAQTAYYRYPLEAFEASGDALEVRVGPNSFTSTGFHVELDDGALRVTGDLAFTGLARWPRRLLAPGVMGWYSWVPRMECYHGLVSLDHELSGELDLGAPVEFTGGRGYIEKDWGTSFPSAYVWMQSNHFDAPGVSLMASVARIPWRGASFTGFLATLLLDGEILPFATWSGARLEVVEIAGSEVHLVVVDRRHRLEIRAARPGDPGRPGDGFGSLHSPVEGAMQARIAETLTAEIQVRLTRSGQPDAALFHGVGQSAGLEIEANTSDLVPEKGDR